MSAASCAVCQEPSQQRCAGCHSVAYCSKLHQKKHWKTHRSHCVPYKVVESPELGRHLICLRALSPGDIVIRECPVVSGPLQTTPPVCLGCYKLLNLLNSRDCSRCGWPVCSVKCEESLSHQPECQVTTQYKESKVKIQTFHAGLPHPSYQCLTVLRCLYFKKTNPELWKKLDRLESHCEERKATAKYEADKSSVAQFILRFFKIPDLTEEEILRVTGIVQVNAHEVPLAEPGYVSIFDVASFLEHNCHANCSKSFTEKGELVIRAAVPIFPGEHFSICYTDPMWGTAGRRHHLLETKFFRCMCVRCEDVTELGTHFSSLRCEATDCKGNVVVSSGAEEEHWSCEMCGKTMSSHQVMSILEKLGSASAALERKCQKSIQKFVVEGEKILHPNHHLLTEAKLTIVQLCDENGVTSVSDEDLLLKLRYCQQLSHLTTTMVPAENRLRGVVLFEMYVATAELGRRKANQGDYGPGELRENLLECRKILLEAHRLLSYEPEILPEGSMAVHARKNLQDIDRILKDIHSMQIAPL